MCSTYNPSLVDYILPSLDLFYKLCNSYDKTELFLATFIRTFIYIAIFYLLMKYTKQEKYIIITKIIIFGIILFNIIYLLLILFKKPKYKEITGQP